MRSTRIPPQFASMVLPILSIFISLTTFAASANECATLLSVTVDISQTGQHFFKAYDDIQARANWKEQFGRPLEIKYKKGFLSYQKVNQIAYSPKQFAIKYPNFKAYTAAVLDRHERKLRIVNKSLSAQPDFLKSIGDKEAQKTYLRLLPGETGQIVIFVNSFVVSSPILSSGATMNQIDMSPMELVTQLPRLITKAGQTPGTTSIDADVLFFHTHPGGVAPISIGDQEVILRAKDLFSASFPNVNFRLLMVAAAKIEQQGDILFVQEHQVSAKK